MGFDEVRSAVDFCPADAPRTWVGIYDHIFLEEAAREIKEMDTPTFHFVYTTSNHGPFKMPLKELGFDKQRVMPEVADKIDEGRAKWLGTYWYSDRAITKFIEEIKAQFPDSLIVVTGDHSAAPIAPADTLKRKEKTLREDICTSFAMYHQDFPQELLADTGVAGHMNIAPTIIELVAPQGHKYYSLFPSMLEKQDHVISPYHWLDEKNVGWTSDSLYQGLEATGEPVETMEEKGGLRYGKEIAGVDALTGWLVRHPELIVKKNAEGEV